MVTFFQLVFVQSFILNFALKNEKHTFFSYNIMQTYFF